MATILVIDDQKTMRLFIQFELERAGYRVLTAEHGKLGLRVLEQEETDLILVDLFMPEMDGLELIPRLRKKRPGIKIIAISGAESNYLDAAKHLGAIGTLKKPFTAQELLDVVSSHLN
jgi:CheY-like chemotaxis protein